MTEEIESKVIVEEVPTMSDEIGEIAAALSKAQGEIESAAKSTENTFFKSKYADLAEVWRAAREPLSKNALSVIQLTNGGPVLVTIRTLLAHSSGQWISSELTVKPVPKYDKELKRVRDVTPQDLGSAITYGRRYSMAAMVGITQDDDDGNAASGKNGTDKPAAKKTAAKPEAPKAAPAATTTSDPAVISEPQRKRLYAIASKREKETGIAAKDLCQEAMENNCKPVPEKTSGILKADYEAVVTSVESIDADNIGVPQ